MLSYFCEFSPQKLVSVYIKIKEVELFEFELSWIMYQTWLIVSQQEPCFLPRVD